MNYDVHGAGLEVRANSAAPPAEMDLRLRGFPGGAGEPALRLEFLEGRELSPPAAVGRPVYDTPYGEVLYFDETDTLWGDLHGVRVRCDASAGVARLQCEDFHGRALYLATHPLATISLMELLERRGRYALHAACLADGGRGVLVAGPTGSGKSTLTLALLRAGLEFVSDDLVFLVPGEPAVAALGFADAVGVTEDAATRFGELRRWAGAERRPGFPKHLVRIEEAFGVTPVASCVPRALVFPEVVRDRRGEVIELPPAEAWLRLVPDVLVTHAASTQAHLRAISALVGQVACYRVLSGTDLAHTAELVRELLRTPA